MSFLRGLRRQARVLGAGLSTYAAHAAWCDGDEDEVRITNWSNTHSCAPLCVFTPESVAEVERVVQAHHKCREPLRPCGSTLSPNGVAFAVAGGSMLNLALCDQILDVDVDKRTVRVQCGARVEQVLDALAPYNLTLENLASIAQQQIGGFVQVGAHGTGASLPPCDEQVLALKIVTPGRGTIDVSPDDADGGKLFRMCRVGLGACGVAVEATMRCVPKHLLREHTSVLTRAEAVSRHAEILQNNRHARFMWIPYADAVVCVTNNPTLPPPLGEGQGAGPTMPESERVAPLRELLERCTGVAVDPGQNFAQLRDALLAHAPLDLEHVKRTNRSEAEFWRRSQGFNVADSSKKLNFECGGEQWVNECAFEVGTYARPSGADMRYMADLLAMIEKHDIPAPAPIEQRWSSSSTSDMSPAFNNVDKTALHTWVGIIMYLPTEDPVQRSAITKAFEGYKKLCEHGLWPRYRAVEHWAKIERPADEDEAKVSRDRLAARFDVKSFAATRALLDPHAILSNELLDAVLPRH
ncbi:hypothetical protein M885DRAFT_509177 [Pelagophyceae sp. CCMP2097]|nr:hypothetical protein M885DRAFT_509177 [Pelagophyceae sp. CCMP2097]